MEAQTEQTHERDSVVQTGIEQAKRIIKESFDKTDDPESENNLPFHNESHSDGVARDAKAVLSILREADLVEEGDEVLGELAAWYHDTVQNFTNVDGKRVRDLGNNEQASANLLTAYMKDHPSEFTLEDQQKAEAGIMATEPFFDILDFTVHQPNIEKESTWFAKAIAMADLGTVGCDTDAFISGGLSLFREENLDITGVINSDTQVVSAEQEALFVDRMKKHLQSQVSFATSQEKRFNDFFFAPLENGDEKSKQAALKLRTFYSHFQDSATRARENVSATAGANFIELANHFGYDSEKIAAYTIRQSRMISRN